MSKAILVILFMAILAIGSIFLQIFLSKKASKWPGLMLPAIILLFSIFAVLGIATFFVTQTVKDGIVIASAIDNRGLSSMLTALYVFVLYNIPTAILLAIYGACRSKRKRIAELEKMNIQDLE